MLYFLNQYNRKGSVLDEYVIVQGKIFLVDWVNSFKFYEIWQKKIKKQILAQKEL